MNRKTKWTPLLILLCIFLLGLSLRLFSAAETRVDTPIRADARDYYLYAYNLRHHHVYSKDAGPLKSPDATPAPDAVRQPGYPLFLTPFVDSLPSNEILGRIVISQALLSTLTLILSFFLYRSFLPVSLALGASLLTAISPHLIAANSYLLTEPPFLPVHYFDGLCSRWICPTTCRAPCPRGWFASGCGKPCKTKPAILSASGGSSFPDSSGVEEGASVFSCHDGRVSLVFCSLVDSESNRTGEAHG
ncbi:MAG: hypothetical protein GX422_18310 [Deltaproteobacteria bacterium]|nr:hypothetical protein [Deltaproteobacteria bacterium]